jgi:PKD repeat protein
VYTVTLTVSDGTLSDSDTSTATIVDFFAASVFVSGRWQDHSSRVGQADVVRSGRA